MKKIYVMGLLNTVSHDPSACLIEARYINDELIDLDYIHFEESMLTRRKKANLFPVLAINQCLIHFGIGLKDLDCVATDYMEHPDWYNSTPKNRKQFSDYIKQHLRDIKNKIDIVCTHHEAHAFSAAWPAGFSNAHVLVMDGSGSEYETGTLFFFDGEKFTKTAQQRGTGVGLLYTLITKKLGFKTGEEGKTMGLAPFSRTSNAPAKQNLGGIDVGYFTDYSNLLNRFPSHSLKQNIRARKQEENIMAEEWIGLAYAVQSELERSLMRTIGKIAQDKRSTNFCYAGGLALNCSANGKIYESGKFSNVFIQPNCGDAGVTLGLAIAGLQKQLTQKNIKTEKLWALGPKKFKKYSAVEWTNLEIKKVFEEHKVPFQPRDDEYLAKRIAAKEIVAYFEGGWEFGPRALGHRSFLATPADPEMKNIMNKKIKHREPYRPFAPILLEEDFEDYFYGEKSACKFMLVAVQAKEKASNNVPAIVHVDSSARAQVIQENEGKIGRLLRQYKRISGNSVLINTSFNDNNEPIVHNPRDALSCFLRTNADILVIEDYVVLRDQISDIPLLLKGISDKSKEMVEVAYQSSFARNFEFKESDEHPDSYINRKLIASLYHRYAGPFEKLEKMVSEASEKITFLTDDYHKRILESCGLFRERPEIIVFKDDVTSIAEIKRQALTMKEKNIILLLFNLSLELRDKLPLNCKIFYNEMESIINMELCKDNAPFDSIKTYEFNGERDFNTYLVQGMFKNFSEKFLVTAQINEMNSSLTQKAFAPYNAG